MRIPIGVPQSSSEQGAWTGVGWEIAIMLSLVVLLTFERGFCFVVDRLARFRRTE
jgi:hypothetical protein